MKRGISFLLTVLLCMFSICAHAGSKPMTKYAPGQMIDIGWGEKVKFVAGCELDDGIGFALVDTYFNDGYLIRTNGMDWQMSISGGLPVSENWEAEIAAAGGYGCVVRLRGDGMFRAYMFGYAPTQVNSDRWVLTGFGQQSGDVFFSAAFSLDRVQAVEQSGEKEQTYTAYYAFYNEANNLDHAKVPGSIEDVKRLEKEYPVAVVSPDDPAARVNLRKGPSTKTERVGSLYRGAQLRIREIRDGWAKIFVGDTEAYIRTDFLTFGAALEDVPDMQPTARVRDGERIEVSRRPYRGGGGSVTWTRGGQDVCIMGEYNDEWRIVSEYPRSYYIHIADLR